LGALALGTCPARPAPPFYGAAALRHVERVVALGPRPAGSPASARTRAYILGELRAASITARVEPFETDTPHGRLTMANVVAVLPGRRPDVILIGGHYDTKWFRDNRFVGGNVGDTRPAVVDVPWSALSARRAS